MDSTTTLPEAALPADAPAAPPVPADAAQPRRRKRAKHSTKALAIRGVAFNWIGRCCSFLVTFVATPIILSRLGNEAYGLWAIVMSVGSYYSLADVGMQSACVKYIAEFEAKGDRAATNRLFSTSLVLYSVMALVVLLAAVPVAWAFPLIFEITEQSVSTVRWATFLTGASIAVKLQSQVFGASIKALKRFDVDNLISVVTQVLQAGLMIAAVTLGYGLVGMAWALLATTILNRGADVWASNWLLGGSPRERMWGFDREMFRRFFRFGSWTVIRQVANRIHHKSAPLIIGLLSGPAVVPFYTLASSLIGKAHSLTMGVSSVVMPVASQLDAQKRHDALLRMMVLSARMMVLLAMTVAVVLFFLGGTFIELWLGPGYAERVEPVLRVLSLVFVADCVSGGMRQMLTGIDRIEFVTKLNFITAGTTVLFGAALVWQIGVMGMAWALLISSVIVNVVICPLMTCRIYGYSYWKFLALVLTPPLAACLPGFVAGWWAVGQSPPTRLLEWFPMAIVVAAPIGLTALVVCLDRGTRRDIAASLGLVRVK
ncbi:MAG: oligosaccharide flippase family protein [Planctomyces sp.]|nr:oligosaccharide flippase family protein [Planctomyces sp.]